LAKKRENQHVISIDLEISKRALILAETSAYSVLAAGWPPRHWGLLSKWLFFG
jgi:hypothetical protein